MDFSDVIGQERIQQHLIETVEKGRIPHAQLFCGKPGYGTLAMAMAYAQLLLCSSHELNSTAYANCRQKVQHLNHPDLHFAYPVNTNDLVKKNSVSSSFSEYWVDFIMNNPYGSLFNWLQELGIENKQGIISVKEAEEITKKLSLKAFEGGFKVMIVWMAEKMNRECSNKILKLLEEPPSKTVLLLVAEREELLLKTIRSRCQELHFQALTDAEISSALQKRKGLTELEAVKVSHRSNGDFNRALEILKEGSDEKIFEEWFVQWVRAAFLAGHKDRIKSRSSVSKLLDWSETVAGSGRETQKKFLTYCLELFRQGMLLNYTAGSLVHFESSSDFSLEKLAPYIHQNNIFKIQSAIEKALYHIERNGNSKIVFSDLSLQLARQIHRKELA